VLPWTELPWIELCRERVGAAFGAVSTGIGSRRGTKLSRTAWVRRRGGRAWDRRLRPVSPVAVGSAGWSARQRRAHRARSHPLLGAARPGVPTRLGGRRRPLPPTRLLRPPGRDRWIEVIARRADSKKRISPGLQRATSIAAVISCIFGMPGS